MQVDDEKRWRPEMVHLVSQQPREEVEEVKDADKIVGVQNHRPEKKEEEKKKEKRNATGE